MDRLTEIEAYRLAVEEAKRIGMTDNEIFEYLKAEWIRDSDLRKLALNLGVHAKELNK